MSTLIGYRKFKGKNKVTGKKDKDFCIMTLVEPYNERQQEYGAVGDSATEIFVPDAFYDLIQPDCIGREVEVVYRASNGKAYVEEIRIS